MDKQNIITKTESMVHEKLQEEKSGHDWYHIERVVKNAREITADEKADTFIVTLAALLHDLADDKVVASEEEGLRFISDWLTQQEVSQADREHILSIIQTMSFKGGNSQAMETLEGKIVQDADRLDAIGAVGIARCFVYSGKKGQAIHNPQLPVREEMTVEEYRNGESTAIHHFYEKLLKLKDLMNTGKGYELAEARHQFMEDFLKQFYREIK
ncbi:HD domain-containing protein [Lentibacillus sediminis]|uniref:HD domain-containing protein n=1 Tax=Lentibacillus sediminis TaxID=1940529 RepID=UPI000C1C04C0|nr:HD domain-containing protein [Lentibacillus sediminis]